VTAGTSRGATATRVGSAAVHTQVVGHGFAPVGLHAGEGAERPIDQFFFGLDPRARRTMAFPRTAEIKSIPFACALATRWYPASSTWPVLSPLTARVVKQQRVEIGLMDLLCRTVKSFAPVYLTASGSAG